MPPVISQALWIVQNAQYIIALFLLFTTLLFSLLGYLLLKYFLPSSISSLFSFSSLSSSGLSSGSKAKGPGRASTPKKKKAAPKASRQSARTRSAGSACAKAGVVGEVYQVTISTLGTGLILCALVSGGVCIWSLTAKGCETLRQVGLIELLPWKTGLRCYRTRWDWVLDIVGEVVYTLLQKSEYGSAALKGINM
ncbi:hypothetical protein IAR50_006917 [Cryptococcus sp. DSM 104548]